MVASFMMELIHHHIILLAKVKLDNHYNFCLILLIKVYFLSPSPCLGCSDSFRLPVSNIALRINYFLCSLNTYGRLFALIDHSINKFHRKYQLYPNFLMFWKLSLFRHPHSFRGRSFSGSGVLACLPSFWKILI